MGLHFITIIEGPSYNHSILHPQGIDSSYHDSLVDLTKEGCHELLTQVSTTEDSGKDDSMGHGLV